MNQITLKKLFFGILLICFGTTVFGAEHQEIRGHLEIKDSNDSLPQFTVLYDGKETMSNSEGFFSFPVEQENITKLALVICKKIDQRFDKINTLEAITVLPDKEYRYVELEKSFLGLWEYKEIKGKKKPSALPKHCVTVLIDPAYVDSVKSWQVNLSSNIIKLPKIVLKKTIDAKQLARAAARSMLYALDSKPFHEPIKHDMQNSDKNPKVKVSLAR